MQAFSHLTFRQTANKESNALWAEVVVDIQGVVDADKTLYRLTDPAIHCQGSRHCFGYTNCGARGIVQFLESHKCNSVCQSLELPRQSSTERVLLSFCSDLFMEQDLGYRPNAMQQTLSVQVERGWDMHNSADS